MFVRWRFWVRVYGFGVLRVKDYTAKFVKSLLAVCSRRFAEVIGSSEKGKAKRLSVSPLYRVVGVGRVEAVYPGGPSQEKIREPSLEDGEVVFFEVGVGGELVNEIPAVIECVSNMPTVRFSGAVITVEPVKAEQLLEYDPADKPLVSLRDTHAVKVVFRSPTLPVNPWKPGSKWKRLLPAPAYILAVNAHDLHDPDQGKVRKAVEAAEKILSPSHTALETTRVYWYRYSGETLPALIGYVKYHVDLQDVTEEEINMVEHLLSHAAVMGVGSGRAAGFGTIEIATE